MKKHEHIVSDCWLLKKREKGNTQRLCFFVSESLLLQGLLSLSLSTSTGESVIAEGFEAL